MEDAPGPVVLRGRSNSLRTRSRLHGPRTRVMSSKLALEVHPDDAEVLPSPPLSGQSTTDSQDAPVDLPEIQPANPDRTSLPARSIPPLSRPPSSHSLPNASPSRPSSSQSLVPSEDAAPPATQPALETTDRSTQAPTPGSATPPPPQVLDRSVQAPSPTPSFASTTRRAPTRPILLPAPPPLDFTPPQLPSGPPYRGLTFHTAHWTLTSSDLQHIVSRAIRRSAREDAIRLFTIDVLDKASRAEIGRVEAAQRGAQGQYRFLAQRRRMLLQGLCAVASTPATGEESVAGKLAMDLAAVLSDMDALAVKMAQLAQEYTTLRSAREVHHASALAVALRKLNTSYSKRTAQVQKAHKRILDLEAELDEAWRVAEELAREVDAIGAKQDMHDLGGEFASAAEPSREYADEPAEAPRRRSQTEGAEELDSPMDGRDAPRRGSQAEPVEEPDSPMDGRNAPRRGSQVEPVEEPDSPMDGRDAPRRGSQDGPLEEPDSPIDAVPMEDQTIAFGRINAPEPSEAELAARAALHRDPEPDVEDVGVSEPEARPGLETQEPEPLEPQQEEHEQYEQEQERQYDSDLDSSDDDDTTGHGAYDDGTTELIGIVPVVRAVASKAKLLASPTSPPPTRATFFPPSSVSPPTPTGPSAASAAASFESLPPPVPPKEAMFSHPPPGPLPSPPTASVLLSGLISTDSLETPSPSRPPPSPRSAGPPLYIPPAPMHPAPMPGGLISASSDAPRLPTPVMVSPLTMRRASAESLKSNASRRVSAAKKRASMKTKGGLHMPRLSGTSMSGPGPRTRRRSNSRSRAAREEESVPVPFPPVPQLPPMEGMAGFEDDRRSFLDMRTPKVSMMTGASAMADEDYSGLADVTVRMPLSAGKGKGREVDLTDQRPHPHLSTSTLGYVPSVHISPDEVLTEPEGDRYLKHASTQGLAPKSMRRASLSEHSSYSYRKRGKRRDSSVGEDGRSRAKSPERLVAWLSLSTLRNKPHKRYSSSPVDELVEEEGEGGGTVEDSDEGHSRSSAGMHAGAEEGASKGIAGRMLGLMDEGHSKAGKMFGKFAQKARRQGQQGGSGQD